MLRFFFFLPSCIQWSEKTSHFPDHSPSPPPLPTNRPSIHQEKRPINNNNDFPWHWKNSQIISAVRGFPGVIVNCWVKNLLSHRQSSRLQDWEENKDLTPIAVVHNGEAVSNHDPWQNFRVPIVSTSLDLPTIGTMTKKSNFCCVKQLEYLPNNGEFEHELPNSNHYEGANACTAKPGRPHHFPERQTKK